MPVQTSLISGTQKHKHSSPSSDGGFLDDNVTGVTGTSTGSILYADASSVLQNLAVGTGGDTLTVSGGLPTWAAGGGASAVVASQTLSSPANDITLSFSAITVTDIARLIVIFNGEGATSNTTSLQVNGITSSNWSRDGFMAYGGTSVTLNDSGKSSCDVGSWQAGEKQFIICSVSANRVAEKIQVAFQTCAESGSLTGCGFLDVAGQTAIDEIKIHTQSPNNLSTGSNLTVLRQNVA
jgi:hypothetical protein